MKASTSPLVMAPDALRHTLLWIAVYAVLSAAIMLPTSLHPTEYKFGSFAISDSLDSIYRLWAETHAAVEDEGGNLTNPLVGAPAGVPIASVHHPSWWVARAAARLGGPLFAFNVVIYLGFVLSALLTHALVRRLTGSDPAALVSALAFSWSPFHILQSADHLNLAQTWVLPLYFLAMLNEIQRRSWASGLALCSAIALATWIHGYYGFFLLTLTPVLLGYQLLRGQIARNREQILRLTGIALGCVLIGLAARATLQTVDAAGVASGMVERPLEHLGIFGVRWYEWLLPPFYSLPFGEPVRSFLSQRMHDSNPAEMTVFLGYGPMLLCLAFWLRSRGAQRPGFLDGPEKVLIQALLLSAAVALALSTTPEVELFGSTWTMPSAMLYEFFPMLRALSRWGLLVIFSVSCVAGLGFASWSARQSSPRGWAAALAICAVIGVEYSPVHRGFYLDASIVPPVYDAVRELPEGSLVLDLPVTTDHDYLAYFWQMHHGRCLYNVPSMEHPNGPQVLGFHAPGLGLEGIVEAARRLGIDAIVVRTQQPAEGGGAFGPAHPNAVVHPQLPYSLLLRLSPARSAETPSRDAPCKRAPQGEAG